MDVTSVDAIALEPLELERLRRLRVEWELAAERANAARQRFEHEAARASAARGVAGPFSIDLERGVLTPRKE